MDKINKCADKIKDLVVDDLTDISVLFEQIKAIANAAECYIELHDIPDIYVRSLFCVIEEVTKNADDDLMAAMDKFYDIAIELEGKNRNADT